MVPARHSSTLGGGGLIELVPHAGNINPNLLVRAASGLPVLGPLERLRHGAIEVGDELFNPLLELLLRTELPRTQQFACEDREPDLEFD